jgi:hypothetical protein
LAIIVAREMECPVKRAAFQFKYEASFFTLCVISYPTANEINEHEIRVNSKSFHSEGEESYALPL